MKAHDYFKIWSENCRLFQNYKPIHSHEDMLRFAEDYKNKSLEGFEDWLRKSVEIEDKNIEDNNIWINGVALNPDEKIIDIFHELK